MNNSARRLGSALVGAVLLCSALSVLTGQEKPVPDTKPRLIVTTDIGGDPDDQQSMVRLMAHADCFDIEGLIASASGTPGELERAVTRPELIRQILEAYARVRPNLLRHAAGFPPLEDLLGRIRSGNPRRGRNAIGPEHDTPGSQLIIQAVDRADPRPVNVVIWGGQTDLAQALWRVREDRDLDRLRAFVAKIRVHDIDDQDGLFEWITAEFPDIFYILSKAPDGHDKREGAYRGMYLGGEEGLTSRQWIEDNVLKGHGPLGALYPTRTWTAPNPHSALKEGDTPSWFFFLRNGLGDPSHPTWGSWGGRFENIGRNIWRDARDTVGNETSARATVWRWRHSFQRQFQARMDWCVRPAAEANHPPKAVLNGDASVAPVRIRAEAGHTVHLSAAESGDPDGDALSCRWWVYREAGTLEGTTAPDAPHDMRTAMRLPEGAAGRQVHVILEVTDDGEPPLTSFRRAVIDIE